jgi:ribosome modulation factor
VIAPIPSTSKLYQRGFDAGYAGRHRSVCPYSWNSAAGSLWLKGWTDGMQQWLVDHPAKGTFVAPEQRR